MYNLEGIAKLVAKRAERDLSRSILLQVEDEYLPNIANFAAIQVTLNFLSRVTNAKDVILQLYGASGNTDAFTLNFDHIAEIVCSDEVLNRAVDLLKEMRQKTT